MKNVLEELSYNVSLFTKKRFMKHPRNTHFLLLNGDARPCSRPQLGQNRELEKDMLGQRDAEQAVS